MTDNFIQLKNDDLIKLKIKNADGSYTGEMLVFDLKDPDLFLRYQELVEKDKKNRNNLRNQLQIISKRQDLKNKKMLSKNEEDEIKAINEFLKNQEEVYDMFLGENGVKKLLNGRKLSLFTLDEIDDIILDQIRPYIEKMQNKITDRILEKYSKNFENKVMKL